MTGYAYRWTAYGRTGLRPSLRVAHTLTTDSPTLIGATCPPSSPHMPLDLFFFKSQAASGYLRITLRVLYKRVTPYIPFKSCVTLTRETPNSAAIAA